MPYAQHSELSENGESVQFRVIREQHGYFLALLLVFLLLLVPIWSVRYPGMVDYHNHLARTFILSHYRNVPIFAERYLVNYDPKPNLAMDAVVVPLAKVLDVKLAGKLFLSLLALLWCAGCHLLGAVSTGRHNWCALPASLLLYNSNLLYGFVNYVASVALFACALAIWLRARKGRRALRILTCAVLAMLVFLAHLAGYAALLLAALVVSWVSNRADGLGHRSVSVMRETWYLALPVPFTLIFAHHIDRAIGPIENPIVWNTFTGKLIALFPFFTYNHHWDVLFLATVGGCGYLLARRHTVIQPFLWASGVLFLLFLVLPMGLLTVSAVDARCVLPAWLLAILSFQVEWDRTTIIAFLVCTGVLLVRECEIEQNWRGLSRATERVVNLARFIAPNASVYPLIGDLDKQEIATMHADEYWTISRHIYLPTLFALPGQAPLSFRTIPCYKTPAPDRAWLECLRDYDYAWTLALGQPYEAELAKVAKPVIREGAIAIWRVDKVGEGDPSRPFP